MTPLASIGGMVKILGDNASKELSLFVEEKWDLPMSKTATRLTHMKLRFRVQRFLMWSNEMNEMRNGFPFYIEMEV